MRRCPSLLPLPLLVLLLIAACTDAPKVDTSGEVPVIVVPEKTGKPIAVSLPTGTSFTVSLVEPIASAADKMGGTIAALVSGDVNDPSGRAVIPSGSRLQIRIDEIDGVTSVRPQGMIRLSPQAITIERAEVDIKARIDSIPHRLVDRMLLVERGSMLTVTLTAPLLTSMIP